MLDTNQFRFDGARIFCEHLQGRLASEDMVRAMQPMIRF